MEIDQLLNNIYTLPDASKLSIRALIVETSYPKGHILLKANRVEKKVFFIKKGIVRAYAYAGDQEVTFWFGREGDPVLSMNSYVANQDGYEDIELLESGELYELETEALRRLYEQDIHIANWGRRLAEHELIKTEERLISRQFRTATERYKELLTYNPDLLQRVKLAHIASYLGITQVSLSRIRADIK